MSKEKQSPLSQAGPPPCEKHFCEMFAACKAQRMACDAFSIYVTTGRSIDPRMRHDNRKPRKGVTGRKPLRFGNMIAGKAPIPMKETFDRIFSCQKAAVRKPK